MPSGLAAGSRVVYRITEGTSITSPLARQLLHLACHAENLPALIDARTRAGVILDRWWWSTIAYGWFGGLGPDVTRQDFFDTVHMCWAGFEADVVFLFMSPHMQDVHNSPAVADGYRWLAQQNSRIAVDIPNATPEYTTDFILSELRRRDLLIG